VAAAGNDCQLAHQTRRDAIDAADRNGRSPSPWLRVAREKAAAAGAAQMSMDVPPPRLSSDPATGRRS